MTQVFGTRTGGSSVLSYNLQFDKDGNNQNFISIVGEAPDNLDLTITKGGLTTNLIYSFKYRIKTKYGWSDFSPVLQVRTATQPHVIQFVNFQIVDLTNVRVDWI